ncbi:cytochrome P450 [Truncatella angustata]|uniref:Cytochrome P450 n=1 Tax=Truncatella angustata TaxID=152316 RepID=A0A9P8UVW1_9PEZI|nr:cytochrome P450 [Truncatella angustata]KAH6659153.1 cytochrome P450 [Truncatella angustata]KAH8204888.1 hypothetical protein TruAng_000927 [Truncatella angustata]
MRFSISQLYDTLPGFFVEFALLLTVALSWQYVRREVKRTKARRLGCLPVKTLPQRLPDFGLTNIIRVMKAFKSGKLLELTESRFQSARASTVAVTTLGRTTIWTMDPKNVQSILAFDFKAWSIGSRRKGAFKTLLGKGIFTSDGDDWKHSRELLRPSFLRRRITSFHVFEHHIGAFLKCIPSDGKTIVDLHGLFMHLTMDISTEFLFGKSTSRLSQQDDEKTALFAAAFERAQEAAGAATRNGPIGKILGLGGTSKDVALVHDFVDSIIADRLLAEKDSGLTSSSDYIFLDELIEKFSDPVKVRSELLQILLAGRDTTAAMLTNFWWCISRHPEANSRLRQEIEQLQGTQPTFEQVKELRYLLAAINESLRLYPVVPVNLREAVEDTVLPVGGGEDGQAPVFVPKGQAVMWNLWTMHRREDVYGSDAADYKPERWLAGERSPLRPGFAFLPFNGGPRICLGQQFALTEASYIIVRMIQEFAIIQGVYDGPWREKITLTTVNATGLPYLSDIPPFPIDRIKNVIPLVKIPLKDIDDAATKRQICVASRTHGFFQLDLRGCEDGEKLLSNAEQLFSFSKKAFVEVPCEEKEASSFFKIRSIHGWKKAGFVDSKDVHKRKDRSEMFHVGKDDAIRIVERDEKPMVAYPHLLTDNVRMFYDLIVRSHETGSRLLSIVARDLGIDADDLLARHDIHRNSTDQARLTFTPALEKRPEHESHEEKDLQISLHEHTDFGTLTLLWNQAGGLQIQDKSGQWCYVEPLEGCCICNMGDSMVALTGGKVSSGNHRVVAAPGEQGLVDRYSIVYFMRPNDVGVVEDLSPDADPNGKKVTGKDWVLNKGKAVTKDYGVKKP